MTWAELREQVADMERRLGINLDAATVHLYCHQSDAIAVDVTIETVSDSGVWIAIRDGNR